MRRILGYLLAGLIGALVLGAGAIGILTGTQSGSRWLVRQAAFYAPGELQIAGVQGRLISGLTLSGVDYRLDQSALQLGRIELRWRPAALLHGTLRVGLLDAQDVHYSEAQAGTGGEPFTLPDRIELPFGVRLDAARITHLQLTFGDERNTIDKVSLSAVAGPVRGLVVKQFEISTPEGSAEISGKATLRRPYPFSGELSWRAQLPDHVPAEGRAQLAGDIEEVHVAHTLSQPFSLITEGSVRLGAGSPHFKLSGHWRNLRWPLSGNADYRSTHGDYQVEGTTDKYRLSLNGPVEGTDIPALEVRASGLGNSSRISLDALNVVGLDGSASASGTLAWAPTFSLGLDIKGTGLNPGKRWPQWPGRLDIVTHLDVSSERETVLVALQKLDLKGTLLGEQLSAQGALALRDGIPATSGLVVRSGGNSLRLTGTLDRSTGIRFTLEAPQLSALLPGLGGEASAEGLLKGPPERPAGTLQLSASALAYAGNSVAKLGIEARFDAARPESGRISLNADNAQVGGEAIDSVAIVSHGWFDRHQARVQLSAARGTADLELQGAYLDQRWEGRLASATIALRELGEWRLRKPVPLQLSATEVAPFKGCWDSQQREVCVQGERHADTAKLALAGSSTEAHVNAEVAITRLGSARPAVAGDLNLRVPDIRFLDPLAPDITVAGGGVTAHARLGGYLDAPELTGTAELNNALLKIPELGVELEQVSLRAHADGRRATLDGTARSGDGNIRLDGDLLLDPQHGWPFDIGVAGERFAVARLPDLHILANPDLRLRGSSQLVDVSGSVLIPSARIKLKELPPDVVKVSADQVIVGRDQVDAGKAAPVIPVTINVDVRLGDDVHFDGLGLSTDLAGTLNVRSLRTRSLIGNGVLELHNGRYESYGQKLAIERGRLLFAGPLDNPALDVRATRTAGDVVAGIELSGTVDAPQTSLFSDPAMSDAEIMSYLVTGKPLNAASSGSDSQALAAAAASLGANSPVAQEISDKLGISVGVDSGTTDADTSLVVGKQLSPQLRVDYLYGLFTETAAIQFIYDLTRHISVAGQSGVAQSIDLRFSFDRP